MSLKDYKCIKQDNLKDCGVSSLLTIINYYHGDMSKEELIVLTNTTKSGVDLYSLSEAARKIGFETTGVKADIHSLNNSILPCIAHVIIDKKYKHFIVVFSINTKKKYLIIGDPSRGVRKVSFSYFNEISTKYFLLLRPLKPIPKLNNAKKMKTFIIQNVFCYKNIYCIVIVISLFLISFTIISTYNFKLLLDKAINYESYYNAYSISLIMILILFLKTTSMYVKENIINYLDNVLSKTFIANIYSHLILLPYLYCKRHTTGEIITRINDIVSLKNIISRYGIEMIINFILSFITFVILFNINKTLTLISLLSILIYLLVTILYSSILNKLVYDSEELNSKVNTHIIESFEGIDTIKNLHLENRWITNLKIKYNHLLKNNYQLLKLYNKEESIKNLLNDIFKNIILLIGVIFVINQKMDISSLIVFVSLEEYWYNPLKTNIDYRMHIVKGKYSFNRIKDLLKVRQEDNTYIKNNFKIENIIIKKLSFSYNYKKNILKDINFTITKEDKIMLKGESGSGKSTFVKILLKYIEIKRNKIFINNRDINDLNISYVRDKICLISQNEFIFSDTIINNIIMNRNISYDTFLKVAKMMLVDEIIEDEDLGYNMLLEENGFNLSGGERQRIILARSILKSSDIYILDESLGEVDIKKERIILKNLFSYYKDKIFIVISHRNNNKDLFNKVIYLKEGFLYYE